MADPDVTGPCVVVCSPPRFPRRDTSLCPTCGTQQRFAGYDQLWYGTTWTCLGCGDQWNGDEMLLRPFKPRWRKENIVRAERIWEEAGQYTDDDWRAWLDQESKGANHA